MAAGGSDDGERLLARLGQRVRALRGQRALTARALAARSGLSLRFVSQLEAGQANISLGRLAGVARALGVELADLVAGDAPTPQASIQELLRGRSPDELERCRRLLELALGRPRPRAVALLGLRGAGKSTLGQRAARVLGLEFVELDDRIEAAAGLSLAEVFALHGEEYYRRLQDQCLLEALSAPAPAVVALPGGLVHSAAAFEQVRRHATTVWLRADPEDHMRRVLAQGDRRPMADRQDAMAELRSLLAAREPLYRQARVVVDTSRLGEDGSLAALLGELAREGWAAAS